MSKRQFKVQASSSRATSGGFGLANAGFGAGFSTLGSTSSSSLSYISEPPDLSTISEPHVVVAFKNLTKKDSTTKAKALEELLAYVLAKKEAGGIEEAILTSWISLYPRTSIDSSRRVRQLAHTLQGQIASSCGKRFARYMPKLAAAWLAGLYDNDKQVSRATQDSMKLVFNSPEKLRAVWEIYQQSILEYSRDAMLRETVQSLSDERTVSPDEAEAKYARVVATSIAVLTELLSQADAEKPIKDRAALEGLLGESRLWLFASHSDPGVRKALYKLLRIYVDKHRRIISEHLVTISNTFLSKAIRIDQMGSTYEYLETLSYLTKNFSEIWTDFYSDKKPVISRLNAFLKKGSQGGGSRFWEKISILLEDIPREVLPSRLAEAENTLDALLDGINRREEHPGDMPSAWAAYFSLIARIFALMEDDEEKYTLLTGRLLPIFEEYIRPTSGQSRWSVGNTGLQICASGFQTCYELSEYSSRQILAAEWARLSHILLQDVKISQPEQSKEYTQSQNAVAREGDNFFALQSAILRKISLHEDGLELFSRNSLLILKGAIETLNARNGKPYGAASIVVAVVRSSLNLITQAEEGVEVLTTFLERDLPSLLLSPSSKKALETLTACMGLDCATRAWKNNLKTTLNADDSPEKAKVVESLLTALKQKPEMMPIINEQLERFIQNSMRHAVEGETTKWQLVSQAIELSGLAISAEMTDNLLSEMVHALSSETDVLPALDGLSLVARENGDAIKSFVNTERGARLLPDLLFLVESSNDEVAHQATIVNTVVENAISENSEPTLSNMSSLAIIQDAFNETRLTSISIDSLVQRALELMSKVSSDDKATIANQLLPNAAQWAAAVNPLLEIRPDPSLAVTDLFGGALHLIQNGQKAESVDRIALLAQDINGYSTALRIAIYSANVLKSSEITNLVDAGVRDETYRRLALVAQLADENLSMFGTSPLWSQIGPEIEAAILSFVSDTRALIAKMARKVDDSRDANSLFSTSFKVAQQDKFFSDSTGLSPSAFLSAKVFALLKSDMIQHSHHKFEQNSNWEDILRGLVSSPDDSFRLIAVLIGFQDPISNSRGSARLCNQLVANLTGHDFETKPFEGLRQLVILNSIFIHHNKVAVGIPQQRLVFFVKHLIDSIRQPDNVLYSDAEIFRSLAAILPLIKEIYGSHWAQILDALAQRWLTTAALDESSRLATIHSSLKLFSALRSLLGDEPNDDLEDAWKERNKDLFKGLINLLKQSQSLSDDLNQPLKIVNELLARQLSRMPSTSLDAEIVEIYPLLYAESGSIQQSAYDILHYEIPQHQEKISFDTALDQKDAHLPEELLSLILEAPKLASIEDEQVDRTTSIHLRGYLFSWLLVFDHFSNSSYKVKMCYIENLKDGGYLNNLLDFATDLLGHAHGKPIDASKFDIKSYTPGLEETLKRDTQWILIHLMYKCLKSVPSLTKAWWIDCKSRQKGPSVEAWTEKYISHFVIADELLTVNEWIAHQDSEEQLHVKVSEKAREVTASYEIDEQNMQIVIRLPGAYPLRGASVEGINRVGVDERRWRSWLLTTQGVITFSNGNLIDGLTAWKKNVVGALRGQTECAICYSIISADKQLPSKRCGTCKNLFHSLCLYKWFKSSNSSSCPLCRNSFNYS